MKKLFVCLCAAAMLISLAACGGSTADNETSASPSASGDSGTEATGDAETVISKYGYDLTEFAQVDWPTVNLTTSAQQSETGSISMMTRFYIDMITEASQGKVTFTEYWDATLCSATENYENIRDGIADYGEVPSMYEYTPFFLYQIAYSVPFVSTDFALNGYALSALVEQYPEFTAANEAAGVYVSAIRGIENYICPTPQTINQDDFTLSWFDGARLAVGSSSYSKWSEALGAIPITGGSAADNYEKFMNGAIDGAFSSDSLICDYQYYEVCNTIIELDIGARGSTLSCWNLDTWNSFSSEVQDALQGIADLCVEEYNKVLSSAIEDYENTIFNEKGLNRITLSDELKAEWCDAIVSNDDYNTMKLWIAEAEELGYDNAKELMDSFVTCFEDLGYEFPFDIANAY